jgi:copper transport protein
MMNWSMSARRRFWYMLLAAIISLCYVAVPAAMAHTKLASSQPAPDETLQAPPLEIRLTFSGKLEDAVHTLKLFNGTGEQIELGEPVVGAGSKEISVPLPELSGGTYTVAFRVLSADGHPMEGSYKFMVEAAEPAPVPETEPIEPAEPAPGEAAPAPVEEEPAPAAPDEHVHENPADSAEHTGHTDHADTGEHEEHAGGQASEGAPAFPWGSMYVANILYYFTALPLIGWALWSAIYGWREEERKKRLTVGYWLQGLHLIAFLLLAVVQWFDIAAGAAATPFLEILRNTDLGRSWLFTTLLSLAGFALLLRNRYVDAVWALLLIAAKTLRGHAGLAENAAVTRLFDGIHLGAASLWVGGLLALILAVRANKQLFREFTTRFSAIALGSIIVLAVTGAAQALWIAGSLAVILNTDWGLLLLIKLILIVLVIPVAFLLRRSFRASNDGSFRGWLRTDALLLAGIITATGLLTHVSPMPDRQPLNWHVMGETIHMTADLSPNLKGRNTLEVLVWVPEGEGNPHSVTAVVRQASGEEVLAALEPQAANEDRPAFPGFERIDYKGKLRLIKPDAETLIITVERATGEKTVYEKTLSE